MTPLTRFSFVRNGVERKKLHVVGGGAMTIIKPMKEGPLVTQVTPNFKDPVGKDVKPEKPAFGLCRCGQSKNNPFVMEHTAT